MMIVTFFNFIFLAGVRGGFCVGYFLGLYSTILGYYSNHSRCQMERKGREWCLRVKGSLVKMGVVELVSLLRLW